MVVGANCVRPSNVVRSLKAIIESKRIDQSRQRRGLLAAARIVEKEPGNGGHQSSNTRTNAPLASSVIRLRLDGREEREGEGAWSEGKLPFLGKLWESLLRRIIISALSAVVAETRWNAIHGGISLVS